MARVRVAFDVDYDETKMDDEKVIHLFNELVNIGLSDACDSIDSGDYDEVHEASLAVSLEIGGPIIIPV